MSKKMKAAFNFQSAVADVYRDFPDQTATSFFVNALDNMHLRDESYIDLIANDTTRDILDEDDGWLDVKGLIDRTHQRKSSRAAALQDRRVTGIVFKEDSTFIQSLGKKNEVAARTWVFDHELGHTLIPGGFSVDNTLPLNDYPLSESIADAFAAIRHIQRFGHAEDLAEVASWRRAAKLVVHGVTNHMTSPVIDRVIADSASIDFTQLSPAETLEAARQYGHAATPAPAELAAAKKHFAPLRGALKKTRLKNTYAAELLAKSVLSAPDAFTFRIGMKVFNPFLNPDGVIVNGKTVQLTPQKQDRLRKQFQKHARKLGLHDMADHLATAKQPQADQKPPCFDI